VFALATFGFGVWPWAGSAASTWVVGIAAVLVLITAWTGVECKPCARNEEMAVKPVAKKTVKKK